MSEAACVEQIKARVVLLVAEGTQADIQANLTNTRFYQSLAEAVLVMGFYDV